MNLLRQFLASLELRDLAFVAGFVLLLAGGFQISRPWTLVVVGALLVLIAIPWRR